MKFKLNRKQEWVIGIAVIISVLPLILSLSSIRIHKEHSPSLAYSNSQIAKVEKKDGPVGQSSQYSQSELKKMWDESIPIGPYWVPMDQAASSNESVGNWLSFFMLVWFPAIILCYLLRD